jgi:pilus assembly protein Flp/PilA
MKRLGNKIAKFIKNEDGAALVEYGLLLILIAVLAILVIKNVGSKVNNGFQTVNSNLP